MKSTLTSTYSKWMMKVNRKGWGNYIFFLPYFCLFLVFYVVPIFYGLYISLCNWEMVRQRVPQFTGLDNYVDVLKSSEFWSSIYVTLYFLILSLPLLIIIPFILAYLLYKVEFLKSLFRAVYFLPAILSIAIVGILWHWIYNPQFGLLNTFLKIVGLSQVPWITSKTWAMPSIAIMTIWWIYGINMIILLAGLEEIPSSYIEAAKIDGANELQIINQIILPLLKPLFLFVITMGIIGSFQVFGQTFIVTHGGPEKATLVVLHHIYNNAFVFYRMGYGCAASFVLFAIIAVFSFLNFILLRDKHLGGYV